ncbi:polysaccharide deacetylase family protein [Rhizobium tumorigenes]|uniref:polysaccharide deacetylase family protein n=1 Tax=Rhizobium tumorigenes TaxID=2041385 RepID=UPI00241F5BB9|nr:polysaccharide deacetylase family protein [Rhizobium tumorigenes]WFS01706.1 polysaccharide deacetylase family protein [Rhizobium tumorigenes]
MIRLLLTSAALLVAIPAAMSANSAFPAAPVAPVQTALAAPSLAPKPNASAPAVKLVEPHLHVARAGKPATRVALTFDACMGKTDMRILNTLIDQNVPATIFVTARWLRTNPDALALMLSRSDLFELENHGLNHIPTVDRPTLVYGIAAAGSPAAVAQEVQGGSDAMLAHGIPQPRWFRGATAKYDLSAIAQIRALGFEVAGYSINGDAGASLPAAVVEKQYLSAKDGDVLISHINQPTHSSGEGVVKGILDLKARGVQFVRLQDFAVQGDDNTTQQASR